MYYTKLSFLLFCVSLISKAQVNNAELLNKLYPSQPIVYTLKQENIEITNDKNGLQISKHIKEQFIILNESGKSFNTRGIYMSTFVEVKNVKAINYIPNGNKYTKIVVDDIKVGDSNSDGTFYDGSKKITVTYPNTKPGAIIELEYDEIYIEPRFFGSFYITEYYPVIKATCILKCPNSVVINIKDFNTQGLKTTKNEKPSKNENIYTWTIDSIPAFKSEENSPNFKALASYYLFNIKEYQKDNKTIPLVGSVNNLYKWYSDLVKNLNKSPSPQLKHITDSLVANCKSDIEKVKTIYYWVQDKIAYIAYEDGLGGYVPREADIICKRRFGDCKDMASLLNSMGKAANLPIYLTWIGTRDIPYQFSEVPAPMAANHMIAAYITKDTCLFLDATGRHQDLGIHTSFIQGKEAIVGISESEYQVKVVPHIPHTKNYLSDSVNIKLDNTTLVGNGILKLDGYYKVSMQGRITGKSYKEQFDYVSSYCQKGNNKFKLDTFIVLENGRDKPVEIKYAFKIPNYITETKTELFINLNFDKNFMAEYTTKDRTAGFEFNFAFEKKLIVNLLVDKTHTIKYTPENVNYKKGNFEYITSYTNLQSNVIFKSSIKLKNKDISTTQFEAWSEFLNQKNKNSNKSISLNKL